MFHKISAQIRVSDFPPPEHHGNLYLTVFLEKPFDMLDLDIQVMFLGLGSESDFFNLNDCLTFFCDLKLLALLISIFPIIHDPANGRRGIGRYLHQILTGLGGFGNRIS
jgi:hypothetical protein